MIEASIINVFSANRFILAEEVNRFEKAFASYSGVGHCVGVGNGLDALTLSLRSLSLKPTEEVVVPAHTYIASWLAASNAGIRIRPVDADVNTFNIDVEKIENVISANTRVILPVHMYGQACNMTAIGQIAERFKLLVVEDNAQGHGGSWLQKKTGSFGVINATSFYPTKNLGAIGDGGAVTTNDGIKAEFIRQARNYGMSKPDLSALRGWNSRLDEIQAAVLSIKLKSLDEWNLERRKLAAIYLKLLHETGDLILPLSEKEAFHVYHLFVIRTDFRDQLKKFLLDHQIDTKVHYPIPPHLQASYRELGFKPGSFPIAERIAMTALSLPLWPGMKDHQVHYVAETIRKFFN